MTWILRDLPFFDHETSVKVMADEMAVRAYQVVVWVSLTPRSVIDLPADAAKFPAVLDTGLNHNFALRQEHLQSWGDARSDSFVERGRIQIGFQVLPLIRATVWLHPNQRGRQGLASKRASFRLELPEGVAVYPSDQSNPARLPTLGLRALVRNKLKLTMNGERQTVSLRT